MTSRDRLTAAFAALSEDDLLRLQRHSEHSDGVWLGYYIGILVGEGQLDDEDVGTDSEEIRACVRAAAERRAKP